MSQIYISAAHKSSGKTTVSIGLCAALAQRRLNIQPFKKGPDYIDPLWLSKASGNSCYNLDFFTTPEDEILQSFARQKSGKDLVIIEGNKGLFDGMDLHGSDSNAAMANLLQAPVVLVINTMGITRGVAPLLLGYQSFPGAPEIAGVILNNIAGPRHESKLISVVEEYTDIPVVGAIRRNEQMNIDERHLGLIPSNEQDKSQEIISDISNVVQQQVDLDLFVSLARRVEQEVAEEPVAVEAGNIVECRIGIFNDAAFGFYYADDLEVLRQLGAELVNIDAVNDIALPKVDALFIGGGFPETHMQELSANCVLMNAINDFIENDGVVYAECGGLMYLARSLTWNGKTVKMCGIIQADVFMHKKPQGRGYIKLRETGKMTWPQIENESNEFSAHEFHYSSLENLAEGAEYAYEVLRGHGIDGQNDGYIYKNLLANYAHMRNVGNNHWAERFVAHINALKYSTEVS